MIEIFYDRFIVRKLHLMFILKNILFSVVKYFCLETHTLKFI